MFVKQWMGCIEHPHKAIARTPDAVPVYFTRFRDRCLFSEKERVMHMHVPYYFEGSTFVWQGRAVYTWHCIAGYITQCFVKGASACSGVEFVSRGYWP